jgi:hypothetical protein
MNETQTVGEQLIKNNRAAYRKWINDFFGDTRNRYEISSLVAQVTDAVFFSNIDPYNGELISRKLTHSDIYNAIKKNLCIVLSYPRYVKFYVLNDPSNVTLNLGQCAFQLIHGNIYIGNYHKDITPGVVFYSENPPNEAIRLTDYVKFHFIKRLFPFVLYRYYNLHLPGVLTITKDKEYTLVDFLGNSKRGHSAILKAISTGDGSIPPNLITPPTVQPQVQLPAQLTVQPPVQLVQEGGFWSLVCNFFKNLLPCKCSCEDDSQQIDLHQLQDGDSPRLENTNNVFNEDKLSDRFDNCSSKMI